MSDSILGRYPLTIAFVIWCLFVGINFVLGTALAYPWNGYVFAPIFGVVSAVVTGVIVLISFLILYVLRRKLHGKGRLVAMLMLLPLTVTLTAYGAGQPSAASTFEYELGVSPSNKINKLRSFISQGDMQDATVGLQFTADRETLDGLIETKEFGEKLTFEQPIRDIRPDGGLNKIPAWFANESRTAAFEYWSLQDKVGVLDIYFEPDTGNVWVVRQEI